MFHRHAEGSFDPSCCFTIYHGSHLESLDLITANPEEARTWITGLKYLLAGISDEDSLAKRQRTHEQYPLRSHALLLLPVPALLFPDTACPLSSCSVTKPLPLVPVALTWTLVCV